MTVIDIHAHAVPRDCLDLERTGRDGTYGIRVEGTGDDAVAWVDGSRRTGSQGRAQRWTTGRGIDVLHDLPTRLAAMRGMGVDIQVLSVPPFMYFYGIEPAAALACARQLNDGILAMCRDEPASLIGLATVPLNDPALAIGELERTQRLGMRGVVIGSHVHGRKLDDPSLFPFFEAIARTGAMLFLHPHTPHRAYGWDTDRFDGYYLRNLVGNPLETTLGVAALVFGGVMERLPDLKVVLAHAGGVLASVRGRWEWAWQEIPDCQTIEQPPSTYLARCYYDTIAHDPAILSHLIETVGASHLVLGTDYPFDIGDPRPRASIAAASADEGIRAAISGATLAGLLGLGSAMAAGGAPTSA